MSYLRVNYQDVRDYAIRQTDGSGGSRFFRYHDSRAPIPPPGSSQRSRISVGGQRSDRGVHSKCARIEDVKTRVLSNLPYAAWALAVLGCTCAPSGSETSETKGAPPAIDEGQVTTEVASAAGPAPVALVLDPSGALCGAAVNAVAGRRHVLCDRTKKEDLSATALRRALGQLKAERGSAVAAADAWLLAAPGSAAVARSLAMREPAFFSRVAAWVGPSPATAGLFGPTFLGAVGGRGFRALALVGPGAEQAESWTDLARRSGIVLTIWQADEADVWPRLEEALSAGTVAREDRAP